MLVQLFERCTEVGAIEFILSGYVGGDSRIEKLESILSGFGAVTRTGPAWGSLRRLPPIPWPKGVEVLTVPCTPHWRAWEYLTRRGITIQQVRDWGIGFGRSGKLTDYIVFPVYMDHALVYWQGRATWDPPPGLSKEERRAWVDETKYRKTLNPWAKEGSSNATASDVIFNYDRASICEHVVICEGPIDAIKVGTHAVALFGKNSSETKIDRLTKMSASLFTIYLDRGKEEREKAEALARELEAFARVRIATPPEGHDPGSLTPEQNAAVIEAAEPFRSDLLRSTL